MLKNIFDKLQRDTNRFDDEADRNDEAGAKRRAQFAKQTKKTLAVTDIEIPNNYPPVDHDKFLALVEDIRVKGIRERIEVTERRGRYILEHGRARLEAAKRLKHETIKVIVLGEYKPTAAKESKLRAPLPNEWDLVQQARGGDLEARNKLVDRYYWLAVSEAYKGRRKMEREDASSVAFDAITKAIGTWNPERAKLSTWVGQKVKGELTTLRRAMRKQGVADFSPTEEKQYWAHRNRKNTRRVPLDDGRVRIERLDDPSVYQIVTPRRRKKLWVIPVIPGEIVERERRQQVRADLRFDALQTILTEIPHLHEWLKRRKNVNKEDQQIAKMLFIDHRRLEWTEKVGADTFPCILHEAAWLPDEVCKELKITRSKLNAAVTRICKTVTGLSDKELLSRHDAEQAERIATRMIGPVPSYKEALGVLRNHFFATYSREPRDDWTLAHHVETAIEGKTGAIYRRLSECVAIVKRGPQTPQLLYSSNT